MKIHFLVKTENGEKNFVGVDNTYGVVYAFRNVRSISEKDFEYVISEIRKTEPLEMSGAGGVKSLSLPSELHRLSGISYAKMECEFSLDYVAVDFATNEMQIERRWELHLKQWPDGFVKVEEVTPPVLSK